MLIRYWLLLFYYTGYWFHTYFSSTAPQVLRLQVINVEPEVKVGVAVYYRSPHRLDVYHDGQ